MTTAAGPFDVKTTPQPGADGDPIGRLILDKQFHGDLEATSAGQMLGYRSAIEGSAGYVAMERVTGRLHGRHGSFVLQHAGTMTRGALRLDISVVPDSGTDELAGLSGSMTIDATGGKHRYVFEYQITPPS
jgi:hypothetical protein